MSAPASTEPGVVANKKLVNISTETAVTVNTGLLMDGKLAMMASAQKNC